MLANFKSWNVLSIVDLTKPNITAILSSVVRQISRQTLPDLKLSRTNCDHTHLNTQTTKAITKLIQILVLFGSIALTKNSTQKSIRNSGKLGTTQFTQLWMLFKHDYQESQDILTEHSKEQSIHRYDIRKIKQFQHFFNSRTSIVYYLFHSKLF